jgi:nucleotide-binding universal stress UspA family protein
MYDFKRIVVGLELNSDGDAVSMGSHKALQQAIWVAKANGGSIHCMHSTFNDEYHTPVPTHSEVVHVGLSDEGRAALEACVAEVQNSGVQAELTVSAGRIHVDMIQLVLRLPAQLVIIGKRNEPAEDGRRLGSVATKLLRKCPTPIWVVRPEHDLVHRLVLAATDLTAVGDQAVRCAAYVAQRHACDLHVVHAWQMPMELQLECARMSDAELDESVECIRKACLEHITESLRTYEGEREPVVHISKGSPAQTIREAVTHLDPDLLVMGTVSRSGVAGLMLGSTAERMLDRVDCSILAVKPEGFVSPITA